MTDMPAARSFRRVATAALATIYLVILAGSIVRASGAGMGCPDWPTCFGRWIPPTDESQLPADYHSLYAGRGYADTDFNPVKTWTEYVNRLLGASAGVLVLLTLLYSVPFLQRDRAIFSLSLGIFFLMGFQGWLGSYVVASNLRPIMITAHMLTALTIVALLIYAITRSQRDSLASAGMTDLPERFNTVLLVALGMTLVQIAMGTQIREAVDAISTALDGSERHLWRERFPLIFYVHRTFSAVILLTNLWLAWTLVRRLGSRNRLARFGILLASLVVAGILTGVSLDRLGFPAFIQPLHLLLAHLVFGVQFFLWMAGRYARRRDSLDQSGALRSAAFDRCDR
jgi:cytochrome c oxidase assembly protein subunit 15